MLPVIDGNELTIVDIMLSAGELWLIPKYDSELIEFVQELRNDTNERNPGGKARSAEIQFVHI